MRRVLGGLVAAALSGAPAGAQEALLPGTGWGLGIGLSTWSLGTPLPQAGGAVTGLAQVAMPFRLSTSVGRWGVDLTGAWSSAGATMAGTDENGASVERMAVISGPTDVRLRFTGPIVGDHLVLTAGVNLPTGRTGLGTDETFALQAIGAPAFRMPVSLFGSGFGYTVGAVRAFDAGTSAFALGASLEQRSEFTPIALALADGDVETRLTPGSAIHLTAALDRPLGESVWSLVVVGDLFGADQVMASDGSVPPTEYTLGPQVTVMTQLAFGGGRWREGVASLTAQLRSDFADSSGTAVAGSGGSYLEGAVSGVLGAVGRTGLVLGADVRRHSGLAFTDALVGMATMAGGLSVGVELPRRGSVMRVVLRAQAGTFDTGKTKSSGSGVTLGVSLASRRAR